MKGTKLEKKIVRWAYEFSKNTDFMNALKELIEIDFKCEAVIGDALKRDQLKFLYESARAFYESPVKTKLVSQEEQTKTAENYILKEMLPRLTTFRTLVYMHDIDLRKKKDLEEEEKKRAEAARLEALKPKPEPTPEELEAAAAAEEEKKEEKKDSEEEEELDPEALAEKLKEEKRLKQEAEDAKYGRYYIWEGIVPEQRYEEWRAAADKIDGINPHVIEDIQDYIIAQSYKADTPEGKKELAEAFKKYEEEQEARLASEKEEEKILAKVETRLEKYRPDKRVWNYFLEKDSIYFQGHKFRFAADPFGIYVDGRVEKLWDSVKALEAHLKLFEEVKWGLLVKYVYAILVDDYAKEEQARYQGQSP